MKSTTSSSTNLAENLAKIQCQLSVRLGYFEKAVDYVLDKNRELYERLS
jgi:hypothetical protein